jgi:hypothetical protein
VVVLCAVIAVPTFNALRNYYFDPAYARDDYRGIAQRILKMQRPLMRCCWIRRISGKSSPIIIQTARMCIRCLSSDR